MDARETAPSAERNKQPILEVLVRDALYGVTDRPIVIGKHDANGAPLVPLAGALTAANLSEPLRRVVEMVVAPDRLRPPRRDDGLRITIAPEAMRTPFFCSGCPHNTSTKVPEGALVGAGIGCHGMIVLMDGPSRGQVLGITQMGGEGAQWIGMAPFVEAPHLFQNLGDGTFCHSGQLAVQAAIAAAPGSAQLSLGIRPRPGPQGDQQVWSREGGDAPRLVLTTIPRPTSIGRTPSAKRALVITTAPNPIKPRNTRRPIGAPSSLTRSRIGRCDTRAGRGRESMPTAPHPPGPLPCARRTRRSPSGAGSRPRWWTG